MTTEVKNQTELHAALNQQTANWFLLGVKLHHYHWYVSGSQFFTLHEKFEELYNEAATYADDLAERLLAIGGQPASTMKRYLELSDLQEARGGEDTKGMVMELVRDFKTVSKELQAAIAIAEELEDQPTADLMIGIRSSIEKHSWMLNAFIGV